MDAYERSLKQQADRIRRELSQEGKKGVPAPKPEPKDEFVPSDVPSPIYGYARPKPKIILPTEHSPETRDDSAFRQAKRVAVQEDEVSEAVPPSVVPEPETEPITDTVDESATESVNESVPTADEAPLTQPDLDVVADEAPAMETLEEMVAKQTEVPVEAPIISTETSEPIDENPTVSEDELAEPDVKPLLGEVSIVENEFASVFMGSTDLKSSKISVREEKQDVMEPPSSNEATVERVAPIVEDVASTLQPEQPGEVPDEEALTPAMSVSYKAEGPPLNVMMTPQDRMAMYKSRRLAKKNNNL